MQLALYYINEELRKNQYVFTDKNSFVQYHDDVVNGRMAGWFAFVWDDFIMNSSEEQTMVQILQIVKTSIQNKGSHISVAELQAIPTQDSDFKVLYSRKPFSTVELIKIIDALIQMLQGTYGYSNYEIDIDYRY
jgi:ubiquinone biosynthesis protein Coq4